MRMPRAAWFALAAGFLAAASRRPAVRARRIVRISRVVTDLDASETFYRDVLGFRPIVRCTAALGLPGARETVMRLGDDIIALVRPATPGRGYPTDSNSNDLWFQHLAIVVSDMDAAFAHLSRFQPAPISRGGPVLLPAKNGGVRAFKFRDPDGHPLELLWFPPGAGRAVWQDKQGLFLGIDHSALAVASTARSLRFYRALGLRVSARSWNQGPAQSELDGLADARVRVTGLRPALLDGPGLELLAYHPPGRQGATQPDDMATDWVTVAVDSLVGERHRALRDPNGHRIVLIPQGDIAC